MAENRQSYHISWDRHLPVRLRHHQQIAESHREPATRWTQATVQQMEAVHR